MGVYIYAVSRVPVPDFKLQFRLPVLEGKMLGSWSGNSPLDSMLLIAHTRDQGVQAARLQAWRYFDDIRNLVGQIVVNS